MEQYDSRPASISTYTLYTICLTSLLLLLLSLSSCRNATISPTFQRPPSILLIMTDDQGWGDLGFHGNDSIYTPVLDRLARQSSRLTRFYVSPVCAPTRASLLTGRYHLRTGTSFVTARRETMRSEETTIAEVLQDNGYATGLFGKWHNGEHYPNDPLGQGFDTFFGFSAGHWNNYFNTTLYENNRPVQTNGFITNVLTDRAMSFIDQHKEQPFLCYVPYNAPHSPFQVPDAYFDKYKAKGLTDKNASVYGMVENIDEQVGRLLDQLDSLGIADNTIVVFLTDNGSNGDRYNGGMRGWKGSVHEGGVRVPCFIRWPGAIPADHDLNMLAAHIDLMPTLLDLAGIALPDSLSLDGRSLAPWLAGEAGTMPERTLFTAHMSWDTSQTVGALRNDRYRMVVEWNGRSQLYDMQNDPGQKNDLAAQQQQLTDSLRLQYDQWLADVRSSGLTPPPIEVGHEYHSGDFLPAPEASLQGSLQYQGDGWANDWIINWRQNGDRAVWPLRVVKPDEYQIILHYNLALGSPAPTLQLTSDNKSVTFKVDEVFEGEWVDSPDRVTRGEVYEKSWGKWPAATFNLPAGPTDLSLTLQQPAKGFELKGLSIHREGIE